MRTLWAVVDRTAVLAVGVAAGIAIGLSFHPSGPGPSDIGVPPPSAPAGSPIAITPPGPAPATTAAPVPTTPGGAPIPAEPTPEPAAARTPAATAPVPAIALTPAQSARATADGTVRVGVFGDSFGDGVWAALYHQLGGGGYKVFKFSQEGTGFTRYRSLNLEQRAHDQLAGQPIDVAVISFGANDVQGVYGDDGHVYALMSPGWQRTIGDRVTRFVNQIRATGAPVYWIGLPVMKKPSYDADVQAMNGFYQRLMGSLGVPWIDTRPLTVGPDGGYAPYLPDATGTPRLMRAGDGIHMSMNGYGRLTAGVAARIRSFGDDLRARRGGNTVPAVATSGSPPPTPARPAAADRPAARIKPKPTAPAPAETPATPPPAEAPRAPLSLPELEDHGRAAAPPPAPSLLPPALAAPDAGAAPSDKLRKHRHRHDDDPADAPADPGPSRQ